MEKSQVARGWERQRSGRFNQLRVKPFLRALADVIGSDIEFLATGERVESSRAESSQIKEPKK